MPYARVADMEEILLDEFSGYEQMFYQSLRIRLVEEKIIEIYDTDKIQSPVHLSIGQEAVAVGVCSNLTPKDKIFITYRGHAYYLAKGGPLPEFFAELFGRGSGLSKGKAGSMHLAAPTVGLMGASAIVASTIPHAVGYSLSNKIKQINNLCVAIFGDGALEQGVYHESINFASLNNLPVLLICENNDLAVHAKIMSRQAFSIKNHCLSYGIKYFYVDDGYNPVSVSNVVKEAIKISQQNSKPVLVEVKTCRYMEHVGPNEDFDSGYRIEKHVNKWKEKDPLCSNRELVTKFSPIIQEEIQKAVEFAEKDDFPSGEEILTDVI